MIAFVGCLQQEHSCCTLQRAAIAFGMRKTVSRPDDAIA